MLSVAAGKFRRWLLQEKETEPRGSPRLLEPEVIVHYWDGSAPKGHYLRDISETGAYLYTEEQWYPGTIVRLILQGNQAEARLHDATVPTPSACIAARVVRQGADGVAVEFAFRSNEERVAFRAFLKDIPAQPPRAAGPQ